MQAAASSMAGKSLPRSGLAKSAEAVERRAAAIRAATASVVKQQAGDDRGGMEDAPVGSAVSGHAVLCGAALQLLAALVPMHASALSDSRIPSAVVSVVCCQPLWDATFTNAAPAPWLHALWQASNVKNADTMAAVLRPALHALEQMVAVSCEAAAQALSAEALPVLLHLLQSEPHGPAAQDGVWESVGKGVAECLDGILSHAQGVLDTAIEDGGAAVAAKRVQAAANGRSWGSSGGRGSSSASSTGSIQRTTSASLGDTGAASSSSLGRACSTKTVSALLTLLTQTEAGAERANGVTCLLALALAASRESRAAALQHEEGCAELWRLVGECGQGAPLRCVQWLASDETLRVALARQLAKVGGGGR